MLGTLVYLWQADYPFFVRYMCFSRVNIVEESHIYSRSQWPRDLGRATHTATSVVRRPYDSCPIK
jgi:hypothetical protein